MIVYIGYRFVYLFNFVLLFEWVRAVRVVGRVRVTLDCIRALRTVRGECLVFSVGGFVVFRDVWESGRLSNVCGFRFCICDFIEFFVFVSG